MARTKKVKSAGRFGVGYGRKVRANFVKIESVQRKKQKCPFCDFNGVKRKAAGIWSCSKCRKEFASSAYFISN